MKTGTIIKTILILTIGVILFIMPTYVFAETTDTGLEDFWEDQGGLEDIGGDTNTDTSINTNTNTNTNTDTNTNANTNTNTNTNANTNTNIPEAGLAEDTMMMVAIFVLGVTAIYTFKKVKEYQNI